MRKLFTYLSVAVLAMVAVSCQKDLGVVEGGNGNVTFTIQTPEVSTRSIADGENVNVVYYEIYKAGATQPLIDSKIEIGLDTKINGQITMPIITEYKNSNHAALDGFMENARA